MNGFKFGLIIAGNVFIFHSGKYFLKLVYNKVLWLWFSNVHSVLMEVWHS